MALFNFGMKKKAQNDNPYAKILILGSGCPKCMALEANVHDALKNMGREDSVGHIRDIQKIAEYGIMSTPGLVVDGNVVSFGKVLKTNEIQEILGNK